MNTASQTVPPRQRRKLPSFWISSLASLLVVVAFAAQSTAFVHWFVLPVSLCGALIGKDAVEWLRGRYTVFGPIGILGMIGWHFFFLAPLLHVHWDWWMWGVSPPSDWRTWIGVMATVNAVGLIAYHAVRKVRWGRTAPLHPARRTPIHTPPRYKWVLSTRQFAFVVVPALGLTFALQLWVYSQFGGVMGYIAAFEVGSRPVEGMGWVFMVSESFPTLAILVYAIAAVRYKRLRSWQAVVTAIAVFIALKMFFGGLRGSRANILWGLFWAVGVIHFWVRPMTRRFALVGVVAVVSFTYIYGLYKGAGTEIVRITEGIEAMQSLEGGERRGFRMVLLGDLARADVQSYVLYRLIGADTDYEYALGRTYVGALALLVPSSIWPDRPPHKAKEGTEIQYGRGSYTGSFESSRQYGLAGETMLNFGVLPVILAYALFGLVVRRMHAWYRQWPVGDARYLVLPFLINLLFVILVTDSDNIVVFIIKNGLVPLAVLALSCKRVALRHRTSVTTSHVAPVAGSRLGGSFQRALT